MYWIVKNNGRAAQTPNLRILPRGCRELPWRCRNFGAVIVRNIIVFYLVKITHAIRSIEASYGISNMNILIIPSEIIYQILWHFTKLDDLIFFSFTCKSLNEEIKWYYKGLIHHIFKTTTTNKRLLSIITDIEDMRYNLINRSMISINTRYIRKIFAVNILAFDAIRILQFWINQYDYMHNNEDQGDFKDNLRYQVKLIKDNYMEEFNRVFQYSMLYHKYYNERYSMNITFMVEKINNVIRIMNTETYDTSFFTDFFKSVNTSKLIKF
jgi:hypothetical protein